MIDSLSTTPAEQERVAQLMESDARRLAGCNRADPHGAHETAGDQCSGVHVANGHPHGYLWGCVACEEMCHCQIGYDVCIFDGLHNGNADIAGQA
jgi:hypothetical protein